MIFSLPIQRTGPEKRREDHVGLLKLEMPANVVQDSNGAHQVDMIHNPT